MGRWDSFPGLNQGCGSSRYLMFGLSYGWARMDDCCSWNHCCLQMIPVFFECASASVTFIKPEELCIQFLPILLSSGGVDVKSWFRKVRLRWPEWNLTDRWARSMAWSESSSVHQKDRQSWIDVLQRKLIAMWSNWVHDWRVQSGFQVTAIVLKVSAGQV